MAVFSQTIPLNYVKAVVPAGGTNDFVSCLLWSRTNSPKPFRGFGELCRLPFGIAIGKRDVLYRC